MISERRTGSSLVRLAAVLAACAAFRTVRSLLGLTPHCVTLAEEPSPSPDVAGGIVHCGNASGNYCAGINIGNQTNGVVGDLQSGVTYV